MLSILLALAIPRVVLGAEYRIKTPSEFSTFVNNVNGGTNYAGTTVLLDSDLSLPEITSPIGPSSNYYFQGTFDGQGHIISDLKLSSSSIVNLALFGYSTCLTIKNLVLDDSCSVTSSYSGTSPPL